MGFIDKNLMDDEKVVYRAKSHWIIFIKPIVWSIVFIIFMLLSSQYAGKNSENLIFWIAIIIFIFTVISGVVALIDYKTTEFVITDKRVIAKFGFIKRDLTEILLNKIEGLDLVQSILGRVLNYGAVVANGTGGGKEIASYISNPVKFRTKVQEQILEFNKKSKLQ